MILRASASQIACLPRCTFVLSPAEIADCFLRLLPRPLAEGRGEGISGITSDLAAVLQPSRLASCFTQRV